MRRRTDRAGPVPVMKQLVIWGCGGMAREVNLLCEQTGDRVAGFLDERPEMKGCIVDDRPVLGDIDDIPELRDGVQIICAGVGDPSLKKQFADRTLHAGFTISAPLVHPGVFVSKRNSISPGAVVCAGTTMTVNVRLGAHVIVNRMSTLGHDVLVADYATIAPGANISGNVTIGEGAYIGTGVSIREKVRIGAWAVVGGGAFVKDDVPPGCMVAGVPATIKKQPA